VIKIPNEVIFSVLRTLKGINPGDAYYEAYLGHLAKRKETFFDIYHFSWSWVIENHPKRILEIGTRTGLSLCELLSAYIDYSMIEKIVSCDVFNDGFCSPHLVKLNLQHLNIPVLNKLEFLIGDSKIKIAEFKSSNPGYLFDYILVDGSHDRGDALLDLKNVKDLVNQKGVLVFDDISEDGVFLDPVWQEFKKENLEDFEWHEDYNGKGLGWAIKK
jgi:predicted O-methyltransferase YrrM